MTNEMMTRIADKTTWTLDQLTDVDLRSAKENKSKMFGQKKMKTFWRKRVRITKGGVFLSVFFTNKECEHWIGPFHNFIRFSLVCFASRKEMKEEWKVEIRTQDRMK